MSNLKLLIIAIPSGFIISYLIRIIFGSDFANYVSAGFLLGMFWCLFLQWIVPKISNIWYSNKLKDKIDDVPVKDEGVIDRTKPRGRPKGSLTVPKAVVPVVKHRRRKKNKNKEAITS